MEKHRAVLNAYKKTVAQQNGVADATCKNLALPLLPLSVLLLKFVKELAFEKINIIPVTNQKRRSNRLGCFTA